MHTTVHFHFVDQKGVTENPIRTTRFASITTPLPVRKNDKFGDSKEGLVYDLGNYLFKISNTIVCSQSKVTKAYSKNLLM